MTRQDGRAYDELRPIKITTDFVKFPEGSCLIECGDTKVLCCASIEDKTPPHVAEGEGWVTAEYSMLPRANRERSKRDIAKLKLRHFVTGVSAGIVDEQPMLDLQYSEDSRAQVDLNCVMNELGEIIELQGTGEGRAFTLTEQQELVRLCAKGNLELLKIQKEALGGAL